MLAGDLTTTFLNRALRRVAAGALQKEFDAFAAAESTFCISVFGHIFLDAARLLWPATVVRDWSNIGNHIDIQTGGFQNTHGRITAGAGTFDENVERGEIGGTSFLQAFFNDSGRGKRGGAAGAFET